MLVSTLLEILPDLAILSGPPVEAYYVSTLLEILHIDTIDARLRKPATIVSTLLEILPTATTLRTPDSYSRRSFNPS